MFLWGKYNIMKKPLFLCGLFDILALLANWRWWHVAWRLQLWHEFNSTLAFKIHANLLIFTFLVASMQGDFQKYNCATSSILRWQHNIITCVPIYPWFVVNKHHVTSNWFEYSRWWFNGFRVLFHRFNLAFAGDWTFWPLDV